MVINDMIREIQPLNTDPALPGALVPSNADTVPGERARKPGIL